MSNPFNYSLEENPFERAGRTANFEIARRKSNARKEKRNQLRQAYMNAMNTKRNKNRALRHARINRSNTNTLQENSRIAHNAVVAAEEALHSFNINTMIENARESEERLQSFVEGAPNLLRKLDEQAAEFEAKKKAWNEQNAKRTQEQFNKLRSLPKNEALRQINQMINITRRAHANHIAATRSTAANTRKYLNRAYNNNFDSTLAAYDPALDPSSPEAKAMNKVITNRLKTIKNTRKISRQNLNTNSKLREASLKKIGKNINTNIKMLEKLKKEISKKST